MAMHLPGYWLLPNDDPASLKLSEAQADLILDSGVGLVPTYGLTEVYRQYLPAESYAATVRQVRPIQVANLRLLRRNGTPFLIGNDGQTLDQASIFGEVEYLDELGVFPRPELLRILFTTGRKLFPSRRIGCFEPGCEADFLILRANPLTDIKALRTIETRVKAGAKL